MLMIHRLEVYPESTGKFSRWHLAERPVRATLVVLHPPRLYNGSGIADRFKPVRVQTATKVQNRLSIARGSLRRLESIPRKPNSSLFSRSIRASLTVVLRLSDTRRYWLL